VVAIIGPKVKKNYKSSTTYHHENLLRTKLMAMGTKQNFPGASNSAGPMSDMFSNAGATTVSLDVARSNARNVGLAVPGRPLM
jgi:hypothetical protein